MGSKANESLRRSVWAQSVKRIPKTSTRRGKSSQVYEVKNKDGGKVDLYRYGGEKNKAQQYRDLITGSGSLYGRSKKGKKEQKKIDKERKEWQRVAKEIGVNLNSESDVIQMIDHVMSGRHTKENKPATPQNNTSAQPDPEYKPIKGIPGPVDKGQAQPRPLESAPRTDSRFTNDPSKDAISAGDDLNDWYNEKFIPHLEAEANYGTQQIGHDMGYLLDKMVNGPYELGDVGKLYEKYKEDINKAAD